MKTCGECGYYGSDGTCRRHPPQIVLVALHVGAFGRRDAETEARYPWVDEGDHGCGEFQRALRRVGDDA